MTLTRKALLLLVVLVVGLFLWRTFFYAPVTNKQPSGTHIIAFGDSLTAGVGAGQGEDYPSQLAEMCGKPIVNKGVPGETTADALRRLDKDVIENDPRIVIILLGGNDLLQRLPRTQTFSNLDSMVQQIHATGALVVLVGIKGLPFTDHFGPEYKRVAHARGAIFVGNVLSGIIDNPKLKADQVHPNAAGYKIIAERVHSAIKPYLR
ncbi:MAG: arylesterase [Candidatus Sumerlaeaceae bacterium]